MYERFTERARKVMQLANQEANRFGVEYIGTEHILIGLMLEGNGVGAHVLKANGVTVEKVRDTLRGITPDGQPGDVTLGRRPQSPKAKSAIEHAVNAARDLNHNYVGTEHLLIGICWESEGVAAVMLRSYGVSPEKLIAEARELVAQPKQEFAAAVLPPPAGLTQADVFALIAAERAYQDAKWANNPHPLGEWLLLIDGKLREAITDWQASAKDADVLVRVAYITAVGVACLEQLGGPMVADQIRNMEFTKTNCGYMTPSPRAQCWWQALEAIQARRAATQVQSEAVVAESATVGTRSGGSV